MTTNEERILTGLRAILTLLILAFIGLVTYYIHTTIVSLLTVLRVAGYLILAVVGFLLLCFMIGFILIDIPRHAKKWRS